MADDQPKEEPEVPQEEQESPEEEPQEPEAPQVEESEEPKEEPPKEPETPEEPEEKPPSRREQLRVQDLLRKYGPPEARSQAKSPDFRNKVDADEEVYKTLEDTAQQFGQQQYSQGMDQARYYKWETLVYVDDPQVKAKYPELDPSNKERYHPALTQAMADRFAMVSGYDPGDPSRGIPPTVRNPNVRYIDFIEAEMELADEIASQRVAKTTQNIAKQAASTGLRPDGSSAKRLDLDKAPEDMTDEELQAVVSRNMPRDARGRFIK